MICAERGVRACISHQRTKPVGAANIRQRSDVLSAVDDDPIAYDVACLRVYRANTLLIYGVRLVYPGIFTSIYTFTHLDFIHEKNDYGGE